jgi:hypothetical protein
VLIFGVIPNPALEPNMEKYKLRLTESDDDSRQKTLDELTEFVFQMKGQPLTVITLDAEQSVNWDKDGEVDYQNYYGQEIINQLVGEENNCLVIRNLEQFPVALAMRSGGANWGAVGVDIRLRNEIKEALQIDESGLE